MEVKDLSRQHEVFGMKKYFITGLIILLPVAVTLIVMVFIFNLLTEPFIGLVNEIFAANHIDLTGSVSVRLLGQLIALIVLLGAITLLGLLTRMFFLNTLIGYGEWILHRIPLISPIYKTCKDVVQTVFSEKSSSFKQAVLIPFPTTASKAIGLVTREDMGVLAPTKDKTWIAVFVPTTPNPTSGFLVIVPKEEIIYLTMSVEEAFTCILSCGVILTPIQRTNALPPEPGALDAHH